MRMKTEILHINEESLKKAKELLLGGGLVAFPTETVYGLGAVAYDDAAVKKIYEVKGRPADNPLIVHVHKDYDITSLVTVEHDYALKIAKAFLPGPITIVYKSNGKVSPTVSCGLDTLAVRIPESSAAQEFLRCVNQPIAAPSANISKHVSPVTAMHVYKDFNGKIPLILDGGKCSGGIESTVLDATGEVPVILRKGLITAEMVAEVTGECLYAKDVCTKEARSPGMKYTHYCPNTNTALFERDDVKNAVLLYDEYVNSGKNPVFLTDGEMALKVENRKVELLGNTAEQMASNLYDKLRSLEIYDLIISFKLNVDCELMLSVDNRFQKAFGRSVNINKK